MFNENLLLIVAPRVQDVTSVRVHTGIDLQTGPISRHDITNGTSFRFREWSRSWIGLCAGRITTTPHMPIVPIAVDANAGASGNSSSRLTPKAEVRMRPYISVRIDNRQNNNIDSVQQRLQGSQLHDLVQEVDSRHMGSPFSGMHSSFDENNRSGTGNLTMSLLRDLDRTQNSALCRIADNLGGANVTVVGRQIRFIVADFGQSPKMIKITGRRSSSCIPLRHIRSRTLRRKYAKTKYTNR